MYHKTIGQNIENINNCILVNVYLIIKTWSFEKYLNVSFGYSSICDKLLPNKYIDIHVINVHRLVFISEVCFQNHYSDITGNHSQIFWFVSRFYTNFITECHISVCQSTFLLFLDIIPLIICFSTSDWLVIQHDLLKILKCIFIYMPFEKELGTDISKTNHDERDVSIILYDE